MFLEEHIYCEHLKRVHNIKMESNGSHIDSGFLEDPPPKSNIEIKKESPIIDNSNSEHEEKEVENVFDENGNPVKVKLF